MARSGDTSIIVVIKGFVICAAEIAQIQFRTNDERSEWWVDCVLKGSGRVVPTPHQKTAQDAKADWEQIRDAMFAASLNYLEEWLH